MQISPKSQLVRAAETKTSAKVQRYEDLFRGAESGNRHLKDAFIESAKTGTNADRPAAPGKISGLPAYPGAALDRERIKNIMFLIHVNGGARV